MQDEIWGKSAVSRPCLFKGFNKNLPSSRGLILSAQVSNDLDFWWGNELRNRFQCPSLIKDSWRPLRSLSRSKTDFPVMVTKLKIRQMLYVIICVCCGFVKKSGKAFSCCVDPRCRWWHRRWDEYLEYQLLVMVSALSRFTTLFLSKYVNYYLSKPVFRHFLMATQALFVLRALRIAVADLCFQYSL